MMRAAAALIGLAHLCVMLALAGEDPAQHRGACGLRIAAAAALIAATDAWCAARPLGSAARFLPLVPALLASLLVYLSAATYRDARGTASYLLALCSALITRELALAAAWLAPAASLALAVLLPAAAEWLWLRFVRERYLALQREMTGGWVPTAAVFAALLVLAYVLACVPSPVAARPKDYPQLLLGFALAPLVQASVLTTQAGHFELLQARERERVLRMASERMEEAVRSASEADRAASIRRHDLRHHMAALDELLAAGETDEAQAYAAELAQEVRA